MDPCVSCRPQTFSGRDLWFVPDPVVRTAVSLAHFRLEEDGSRHREPVGLRGLEEVGSGLFQLRWEEGAGRAHSVNSARFPMLAQPAPCEVQSRTLPPGL